MARGTITHIEFPADDLERARRFYSAVAGWQLSEMPGFANYLVFGTEEGHGGGLGKRGESVGDVIRVYITVDSLEESIAAAEANGGSVLVGATELAGMGRYAAVRDSEGNEVGLWEVRPA